MLTWNISLRMLHVLSSSSSSTSSSSSSNVYKVEFVEWTNLKTKLAYCLGKDASESNKAVVQQLFAPTTGIGKLANYLIILPICSQYIYLCRYHGTAIANYSEDV